MTEQQIASAAFHLAFPIQDVESTRRFYVDVLGCSIGRESDHWIDFDFFGNQITGHVAPAECRELQTNRVDGDMVPVRHFGAVLDWDDWEALAQRLRAAGVDFLIDPHLRFPGEVGEQATLFLQDPSGNALEFKSFRDPAKLFASE